MTLSKLCLRLAILALATVQFAAPARSLADTFHIFNLTTDNRFFYGMNASGLVVFDYAASPGCAPSACYYTFLNGISTGVSTTAPIFTADNGTPCTPSVPAGGSVLHGVCNNGRDAFSGKLSSGQVFPNLYFGSAFQDLFTTGSPGLVFMNSRGDIVFDDELGGNWYEAIDLTTAATPEPSSILLLVTGILALAALARRQPILS